MSHSPSREPDDVEATALPSPADDEPAPPTEGTDGNEMSKPEEFGYDFEVKEQDRWLPIANGKSEETLVAPCVPSHCPTLVRPLFVLRRDAPL